MGVVCGNERRTEQLFDNRLSNWKINCDCHGEACGCSWFEQLSCGTYVKSAREEELGKNSKMNQKEKKHLTCRD